MSAMGMIATSARIRFFPSSARSTAPAARMMGARFLIGSAMGASSPARAKLRGMEIRVPMAEPTAILRIVSEARPLPRRSRECSISGADITPPGNPTRAVGMPFIRLSVTIAAMKNASTTCGGAPASTTARVTGASTLVSSVPGMKPMKVYRTTAASTAASIMRISSGVTRHRLYRNCRQNSQRQSRRSHLQIPRRVHWVPRTHRILQIRWVFRIRRDRHFDHHRDHPWNHRR